MVGQIPWASVVVGQASLEAVWVWPTGLLEPAYGQLTIFYSLVLDIWESMVHQGYGAGVWATGFI